MVPSLPSSHIKELYNPKAVFVHAASLGQDSSHCPIFPTAASRRSLGRISVPVWPYTLSGRLPVVALVEPLPHQLADRSRAPPTAHLCFNLSAYGVLASVSRRCPPLQDSFSCCTHPSAAPLVLPHLCFRNVVAQLACVTHAASVYPEPGSNSQFNSDVSIA